MSPSYSYDMRLRINGGNDFIDYFSITETSESSLYYEETKKRCKNINHVHEHIGCTQILLIK